MVGVERSKVGNGGGEGIVGHRRWQREAGSDDQRAVTGKERWRERGSRGEREATSSFFKTHLPNPKTNFYCFVNMVKSV